MLILKNLVNPVLRLLFCSQTTLSLYSSLFRWGLIFPEGGEICLFPRTAHPSKSEPS